MSNIAPSAEDTERAVDKEWHEYTRECMKFCEWPAHTGSCLEIREALLATARAEEREACARTADNETWKGDPTDAGPPTETDYGWHQAALKMAAAIRARAAPSSTGPETVVDAKAAPSAEDTERAGDGAQEEDDSEHYCARCRVWLSLNPGCEWPEDRADDLCHDCAHATVAELRAEVARLTPESQVGRRCAMEQHGDRIERGTADNARLVRELREARAEVARKDAALREVRGWVHPDSEIGKLCSAALSSPSATKEEV